MHLIVEVVFMLGMAVSARAGLPQTPPETPKTSPLLLGPQPRPSSDYGFRYSVNDFKGNEHSHQQSRVGNAVTGQYKVLLPDGRLQTVTYIADENGYRAKVDYTPARPGEATTAGLGINPPIIRPQQQPPPGFGHPFAAQRTGVTTGSIRQIEESNPQSTDPLPDDIDALDVEELDVPSSPTDPTVQRSARKLVDPASRPWNFNRSGRVRYRPRIESYQTPYSLVNRYAY